MLRCLSLLTHLYYYASHVDILRSADTSTFSFGPTIDCIWIVSSPLILIIRSRDILLSYKINSFANSCWGCFLFILSLTNFWQIVIPDLHKIILQIVVWDQFLLLLHIDVPGTFLQILQNVHSSGQHVLQLNVADRRFESFWSGWSALFSGPGGSGGRGGRGGRGGQDGVGGQPG